MKEVTVNYHMESTKRPHSYTRYYANAATASHIEKDVKMILSEDSKSRLIIDSITIK